MILEQFEQQAARALRAWAAVLDWDAAARVVLAQPPGHVQADISLPWPMAAAKALKRKPLDVAAEVRALVATVPGVESVEPSPPGFLNVRFSAEALTRNLAEVAAHPERHGAGDAPTKRSIMLEFVSANPTGPVHLASGRAATLGDSLARILRRRGHKVSTENYVNDVGRQVDLLGLSVKARYDELHGRPASMPEDGYQGGYIRDVAAAVPAEASSWGPAEFGRFGVEKMLASHQEDMRSFGLEFDRWFRESELHGRKALDKALEKLRGLGKVYDKDGAVWLGTSGEGSDDDKDRVLVRSDGRPTYFLADIAYHQDKLERGFDYLVDIWGADHHGYVPRMKEGVAALGVPKDTFHAIIHQLVHLFRGKEAVKMSKRAGEFITLRDLVAEVGLDACRFFFAMRTPNSHLNFDIELAKKKTQENPVYYVQYVHARIASIFREAAKLGLSAPAEWTPDLERLRDPSERAIMMKLAWFPETLALCEKELSPHPLPIYLMELAGLFHPFYERCRVVDKAEPALTAARLELCAGVRAVIADSLGLLGVSAPEAM